ncbi:septum formation family protein [Nocardiopsis sp. CNT312]|uniref:septum formation family protein n=1 Tax=Nocardiopsis sp. CNT312 TaxID=1137268 RepID=UPI0004902ADE|nr:septum formation family protein [Nocardiopsis sp. CNT312]
MAFLSPTVRGAALSAAAVGAALGLTGCGVLMPLLGGSAFQLEVGDCFTEEEVFDSSAQQEVTDVPLVDCAEPHDSEVFLNHDVAGGAFPGDEALQTEAEEACLGQAFTDFVGVPYVDSEIYAGWLVPTQQSWENLDDRRITCYLLVLDETVTGTLQGASR